MEGLEHSGRETHAEEEQKKAALAMSKEVASDLTTPEQEKIAAKQEMEGEIARLWESVGIAESEQKNFGDQVAELEGKIASDEVGDARVNGERIKALNEYRALKKEADARLERDQAQLKKLEAQHRTVFGEPIVN